MKVPSRIVITVKVGDQETQGMFVMLRFATAKKSPYNILFGPSNERGVINVTKDEVLSEAKEAMNLFVMDYGHLETEWTGQLRVTPLNVEAIDRALSAYRLYRKGSSYPPNYEETLNAARRALSGMPGQEMTMAVSCESAEPVAIETPSVRTDGPSVY